MMLAGGCFTRIKELFCTGDSEAPRALTIKYFSTLAEGGEVFFRINKMLRPADEW
jgi:hypothetical protein